jgi:hypothetical protein
MKSERHKSSSNKRKHRTTVIVLIRNVSDPTFPISNRNLPIINRNLVDHPSTKNKKRSFPLLDPLLDPLLGPLLVGFLVGPLV